MGKQKYLSRVMSLFKESPVVSFNSIKLIVKNKKNVRQYTKQLVRNMIKQGKIKRLTRGFYTSRDEISLLVFCFKPSYLGLQDALSIHNLWEQETIPVIISTRKIRPGIRKIFGANMLIRRIDKEYFFGYDYVKQGDFYLPVSDVEKTFIDMVYFRQPLDKEVINEIKRSIDVKKLNLYLKKYPKKFSKRVLSII